MLSKVELEGSEKVRKLKNVIVVIFIQSLEEITVSVLIEMRKQFFEIIEKVCSF